MKIFLRISLLSSFVYLFGCSGGATDKINEENANATPAEKTTPRTNSPQGQAGQNAGNNGTNTNVAVNPPHGEPGHDCAVPVGAPLDASSGGEASQPVQIQQQQQGQAPAQNTPKQGVAEGLNPPHGEPGHDCNVPVGAPLNK